MPKEITTFASAQSHEGLLMDVQNFCRYSYRNGHMAESLLMRTGFTSKMNTTDTSIECHDGHVPEWVAEELDRLYGNIYSSLAHFRLFGGLEHACTYARRRQPDNEIVALFLFRLEHNRVMVLNEGMSLEAEEVKHFAAYIFQRFPSVGVIEFHAVHAPISPIARPIQRFYQTEDFVLQLPETMESYLSMLGSATRKNIKKHLNRWQRDFPDSEYQVYEKREISSADLREVVAFNHRRMAAKNKVSGIDESELQAMLQLAHECGYLCVLRNQGRICAGALLYRFGEHHVSRITAHDTRFDDYRLGTLMCYRAVCEAMQRGGKYFHFMWGRYAYKAALGGVLVELDHIAIYRSYWHLLRQARRAASTAYSGYQREAKIWLLEQAGKNSGWLPRMINAIRTLRRMRPREAC